MKTPLLNFCLLLFFGYNSTAQVSPVSDPNQSPYWKNMFNENFNGTNVNSSNWKIEHGTHRWATEQISFTDQVQVSNGSLKMKLKHEPNGILNPNTGEKYKVGCAREAKFKGSEIFTKQKFLYGYFEARIKLPNGIGAFPGVWIYPLYRNEEQIIVNGNFTNIQLPYPEEIDILEQRSIKPKGNVPGNQFLYDFYSFWGNNQVGSPQSGGHFFTSREKNITDGWHILAVKWDIFGQYFYIDNQLIFTNNLWKRDTYAESSNFALTNNIITDSTNPDFTANGCDYYPTNIVAGEEVLFNYTNSIANEVFEIDWIKIYQKLKHQHPVIWSNPHSANFGTFSFEKNDLNKNDEIIIGNFLPNYQGDEIFSFSLNGLSSALQRLSNYRELYQYDMNTNQVTGLQSFNDVWTVETISKETRPNISGQYTLNNWFSPDTHSNTNYIVGNFIGGDRDQLFMSNTNTKWAAVFNFVDQQGADAYHYNEPYTNGMTNTISYSAGVTQQSYTFRQNDNFYSGDLNGDGKDELILKNKQYNAFKILNNKSTNSNSIVWSQLFSVSNNTINYSGGSWVLSDDDVLLFANFYKQNPSDKTDELFIVNKATKKAILLSYNNSQQVSLFAFTKLWTNENDTPGWIKYWFLNDNKDDFFLAGNLTGVANEELMMVNHYQSHSQIYKFNGSDWEDTSLTYQPKDPHEIINTPVFKNYKIYKYSNKNNQVQTTLFNIERFKNPSLNSNEVTTKYAVNLIDFVKPLVIGGGLKDNKLEDKNSIFEVFPNPMKDVLTVNFKDINLKGSYKIFDYNYNIVLYGKFSYNDKSISTQTLAKGNYIISFEDEAGSIIESKHIIKN